MNVTLPRRIVVIPLDNTLEGSSVILLSVPIVRGK
jgi:hypothetical protein